MSKKKPKKLTGKEDCMDGRHDKVLLKKHNLNPRFPEAESQASNLIKIDNLSAAGSARAKRLQNGTPSNSEDARSYNRTMKGETEVQRFKIEKGGEEKKQDRSPNISHGADGRSQGKSADRSKPTDDSLIQPEKQKRIVIQFKAKEVKHGKSTRTPDAATASSTGYNKSRFDGTERKRLWHSFELQREKALKKKAEKAELCKLKLKAEKTALEKFKSSPYDSHVPHKKADGSKKQSEDVRIPKKLSDTSTGTVCVDRPLSKKPNRTWEKEYEEEYKEFSSKKRHMSKHTPSCYLTETAQRWDCCKRKKTDAESYKATGNSGTEERDLKARGLCFKQDIEVPCTSDSFQEGEDRKYLRKSFEVLLPPQDSQNPETDQEMQIVEDLHVARVQKRMALSVVQTCGELTSMEIDLPEQDLNISAEAFPSGLNILVVIDTNIMISHLEFVRWLKSEDIPGIGKLALIIPWVVLQELDNLKKGKMLQHVRDKAIPAVQFIYMCLKNQDSKLWGQSMQLASQKMYGLSDENNDDRVLQCCLQYQNLFPQAVVILCTDDKNLCNKAIVSEVKAFCKADLITALQKLNGNRHQDHAEPQQAKGVAEKFRMLRALLMFYADYLDLHPKEQHLILGFPVRFSKGAELEKTGRGDASLTARFPNMLPNLEKNLGEALSCILETEMKIAFGNLWMEILYLKPPWTLANLLQCYKKHWMAVFGYVVPRSLLSTIECLYKHLCTDKAVDSSTMRILLQESKKLFHAFSSRSDYNGILPQAYAEVNKLYQTLTEVRSDSEQDLSEDIMVLSENAVCEKMEATTPNLQDSEKEKSLPSFRVAQENRYQEIWSVLEGIWNTMNLYSIEIFRKLDPSTVTKPSFEEAFLGLEKLLAAVNDIREGISRWHLCMCTVTKSEIWGKANTALAAVSAWGSVKHQDFTWCSVLHSDASLQAVKSRFHFSVLGGNWLLLKAAQRILTPTSSFQDIWTLYNFLISHEINNSVKFTAEELYECVSQELYRERLEVGCGQLAQLEHTVKQCHASAHAEAKNRGWL